jgi:uncharacterized protein (DUF924 family)
MSPDEVLRFWFGEPGEPPLARAESWWKKDDDFDREIRERFEETLERGCRGELRDWEQTPRGRLALIVLYDQLSRNMFRGTPRSFAQDSLARAVAEKSLATGDDGVLRSVELTFVLMPFMHAEDMTLQQRCLEGFQRMCNMVTDGELRDDAEKSVKYARMHMAIIERFGRFPHRNEILGRSTTREEAEFLKEPGSSF